MVLRVLLIAFAVVFSTAAIAVSPGEAERVVALVERLAPDLGEIAYDDEEADRWFEDDSANAQLIGKAGFTRESWQEAFDAVMKGYFALVPRAELEAKLNSVRARLSQAQHLSPEQQEEVVASFDKQVTIIHTYREEGRAYTDAVRPLVSRLDPLVSSGMD